MVTEYIDNFSTDENIWLIFQGPELSIDEPDINFGLVQLGQTVTKMITVNNMSQIITAWSIQDSPAFAYSEDDMVNSSLY